MEGVDGEILYGKLSLKEMTRISVSGARIKKWYFNDGELILDKDVDNGFILIKPVRPKKPVNLFITDDKGGTHTLLLEPTDMPAENIFVKDKEQQRRAEASEIEEGEPYERILKNMVLAMALEIPPRGIEMREVHKEVLLWKEAKFVLTRQFIGRNVIGERYLLLNRSDSDMVISEEELFRTGILAVSVEKPNLQPQESTNVFVVRERTQNE